MTIRLTLNGEEREFAAPPMTPLIDVLRDDCHLTGAKPVCREGFCGACMVLVDGIPTVSCLTPIALVEGGKVETVEGLTSADTPPPVQAALEAHDAVQCGMCFPGMVVSLTHLTQPGECDASRAAIKAGLTGHVCRCTGYERIVDAALAVMEGRQ
ncbi:(2Fe-2S)-binding protein [Jiella sp. MQZ9-1]|uniref:(2Fe-2S)-binding protein n=1 Tax=Jiella flava TaxID=2816857 RepID=A0A939JW39_9HYPH|nr:(2Fe-2S)-binding protein [Jiella flava]MBO0663109.1 (2Fe-2S)-binding protein [Jiella flava]MCD2471528.1 (2Fe-2S)-binding protein [Jiella flava]